MIKITQPPVAKPKLITNWVATFFAMILVLPVSIGQAIAGDANIVDVEISATGNGMYSISVTLEHGDTGWDHYANRWDVLDENGELIGSRVLAHPHVNEQPFTRSLRVEIPEGVKTITIVAADSVHGDNEKTFEIEVPMPE